MYTYILVYYCSIIYNVVYVNRIIHCPERLTKNKANIISSAISVFITLNKGELK
jgi:hypothetical protein